MVEPFNAPMNRTADHMAWRNLAQPLFDATSRRDLISRRGQKGRHEHDEDDTQAEQFNWNDVRHQVHRVTLGIDPSPTYREPGETEQGDCALRPGLSDGLGR
jgi:hypothetical protein